MGFGEELVAGPRGRRLCFSAVAGDRLSPLAGADEIAKFFGGLEAAEVEALADLGERELLMALADSVDRAMYWQEPDEVDRALASPEIPRLLLPTARAIASAPSAQWWSSEVDLDAQVHVEFQHGRPPTDRPAAELLAEWRSETVEHERRGRKLPADPAAPYSGHWWSAPIGEFITTTRARPAALGLCLQEDSFGPERAWCRSVRPTGEPCVYEITGPEAWCDLVERYPMEVTLSRRHDWYRVTGWAGRWLIPDWQAVAAEHDAVHLTCTGYLTAAGRALAVGEGRTLLAGWNPDQTCWFTDDLDVDEPVFWRGEPEDLATWAPADPDEVLPEQPAPPRLRAPRGSGRPGRAVQHWKAD